MSSSASPPETPTFFLDRSLGRKTVAEALRSAGLNVVLHDEVFPPDASDAVWLRFAGERKLIVLTKGRAIRTRRLERETLFAASVRAVILTTADLTGSEMAKIFSRRRSQDPQKGRPESRTRHLFAD